VKPGTVVQVSAGIAIAAVGVWVFSRQVQLGEVFREVRQTPLWKIVLAVALTPATLLFRAWRWKYLLVDRGGCSKKGLFPLVAIGFMVNNFFPARIGEAARAALLWKRNRFTVAESVGSLLVERFLDVLVFTLFLFLPILFMPRLSHLRTYGVVCATGFCGVLLGFFAYAKNPTVTKRIAKKSLIVIPPRFRRMIVPIGKELISNLDWLFSLQRTVVVTGLSLLTLACQVATLQVLGWGIAGFGVMVSMFGIAFAAIGAAIPLAPGYVGTLHAMMLSGMGLAGVAADKGGAIAVLYHAIGYVTIAAMGIYYFFSLKISMKEIKESGVRSEKAA
jgi:uncharacterized protein (TIRG00374 family)